MNTDFRPTAILPRRSAPPNAGQLSLKRIPRRAGQEAVPRRSTPRLCYHFFMWAGPAVLGRWTRRAFLVSSLASCAFSEEHGKGALIPSLERQYSDPATDFE